MIRNRQARNADRRKMNRRQFGLTVATAAAGLVSPRIASAADPDWTLVIVPDTQYLALWCTTAYTNMMTWVANNLNISQGGVFTTNIKAVAGVGDCTQTGQASHYTNSAVSWGVLDSAGVPWVMPSGNHDYTGGTQDHLTLLGSGYGASGYFGAATRAAATYGTLPNGGGTSSWGGSFDTINYYIKLTVGTRNIILFSLEFQPRTAVITWAKGIHDANVNYECIIATHAFIAANAELSRYTGESGYNATNGDGPTGNYGFNASATPDANWVSGANANSGYGMWNSYLNVWDRLTMVVNGHFFSYPSGSSPYAYSGDYNFNRVALASSSSRAQTVQAVMCNFQQWDDRTDNSYLHQPGGYDGVSCSSNYCNCLSTPTAWRVAHLMLLHFRPSAAKVDGYCLSTNSGLWEPSYANQTTAGAPTTPSATPNLLFSADYPGITPVPSTSLGGSLLSSGSILIR